MTTRTHYRDPDLTDEAAMAAIVSSANDAARAVLSARGDLLDAGIANSHPMCQVLDSFATCMTEVVTYRRIADPRPTIQRRG